MRKPDKAVVDFDEWLGNLHDVFLNAQLMAALMAAQPLESDPEVFMVSQRGRLERSAMRDMYVLVEAYRRSPQSFRRELARLVPEESARLADLLADASRINALRNVRDYMSHRDARRYYDVGRLDVATVGPQWFQTLEEAFGLMLLRAMRAARLERSAGVPVPEVRDEDGPGLPWPRERRQRHGGSGGARAQRCWTMILFGLTIHTGYE